MGGRDRPMGHLHARKRHRLCVTGTVLVTLLAFGAPGSTAQPAASQQQTYSVTVSGVCFSLGHPSCTRAYPVSGGGTFPAGSTVTLTTQGPHPGYGVVAGWTEN